MHRYFSTCLALCPLLLSTFTHLAAQNVDKDSVITIYSETLQEHRAIQICLPDSYGTSKHSYPVLFLLDGEYIFDYAKGAVDFLTNDFGFVPGLILVGIPNTDRNRDLYVSFEPNGPHQKFLRFLHQELVPYMEENYQTNGYNILFGWSSGAGLANYGMMINPEIFDAYILAGWGIGPKTNTFIKRELNPNLYRKVFLYGSSESAAPRALGLQRYRKLMDSIDPVGMHKKFEIFENTDHVGAMSKGLYKGLEFVFGSYKVPDSIASTNTSSILDYYSHLEKIYGPTSQVPVGAFSELSAKLLLHKKAEEALLLLEHGLQLYPKNHLLWASKAAVHLHENEMELAIACYRQAIKHSHGIIERNKYEVLLKQIAPK
nr:alpha/beta hydrolase-fold protein [Allomuricauda sp.]